MNNSVPSIHLKMWKHICMFCFFWLKTLYISPKVEPPSGGMLCVCLTQRRREVTSNQLLSNHVMGERKQEIYPSNGKVEPLNQATIVFTDLALYCWTKVKKIQRERGSEREREREEWKGGRWIRPHTNAQKTIVHKTAYAINKITSWTITGCCNSINISSPTCSWQDDSCREGSGLTFTKLTWWAGCFKITACIVDALRCYMYFKAFLYAGASFSGNTLRSI